MLVSYDACSVHDYARHMYSHVHHMHIGMGYMCTTGCLHVAYIIVVVQGAYDRVQVLMVP